MCFVMHAYFGLSMLIAYCYASTAKRVKALCSLAVRPSGCPAVRLFGRVLRHLFVLRQHGPTD